jgi:hypothetical protein
MLLEIAEDPDVGDTQGSASAERNTYLLAVLSTLGRCDDMAIKDEK